MALFALVLDVVDQMHASADLSIGIPRAASRLATRTLPSIGIYRALGFNHTRVVSVLDQ